MSNTHAKLSPSGASRWLTCAGSVALIDKAKPAVYEASIYASEGTVAHEIGELVLKKERELSSFLGEEMQADGFKIVVSQEMLDAVGVYVDYCNTKQKEFGSRMRVEVKSSLKHLRVPGLDGGTADCVLINKENLTIEVIDYKHGAGETVEVQENWQLMQYALGVLYVTDICVWDNWTVEMTIVQPRVFHPAGSVHTAILQSEELIAWQNDILIPGAKATHVKNAPLVPSKAGCRWCPVKGDCPKIYEVVQEVAVKEFNALPNPELLTAFQKIKILDNAKLLTNFVGDVKKQVQAEITAGNTEYSDAYKLVRARKQRKFTAEAKDLDFSNLHTHLTHDEIFKTEMRGLGEIEKALKAKIGKEFKAIMEPLTETPEGGVVLAAFTDKRPDVQSELIADFRKLESN